MSDHEQDQYMPSNGVAQRISNAATTIRDAAIAMERAAIMIQSTSVKHTRWAEDIFARQQKLAEGLVSAPEETMPHPVPIMFTVMEGGDWVSWDNRHLFFQGRALHLNFHAIQFSDGSILDIVKGWRS